MSVPEKSEDFAKYVIGLLRGISSDFEISVAGNGRTLFVNGLGLDLSTLKKIANRNPKNADECVTNYLSRTFNAQSLLDLDLPFENMRHHIMPRIQPVSIFENINPELAAHIEFVNDTVIMFVLDHEGTMTSIKTEQMIKWGVTKDDLYTAAIENLQNRELDFEIRYRETKQESRSANIHVADGYDSARLLLPSLHQRLLKTMIGLGDQSFCVWIASRDSCIIAEGHDPDLLKKIAEKVGEAFPDLPYNITTHPFILTKDGVAGATNELVIRNAERIQNGADHYGLVHIAEEMKPPPG